ncbi:hypothetical protein MC885_018153, partial [Smutsia gigantea]
NNLEGVAASVAGAGSGLCPAAAEADGRGDCVPIKSSEVGFPSLRDLTCYSGKRPLTLAFSSLDQEVACFRPESWP